MITFEEARQSTNGAWITPPTQNGPPLRGGAFDTRSMADAEIFFALKGEAGDGHDHLAQLAGSPIRLAVVSQTVTIPGYAGAMLRVDDTLAAMADMARFMVKKTHPTVVAITGSYGKTTAKEIIAHVLEGEKRVLKSPGTLNNEIGIPITLLRLDGSQDIAVLEFSARKEGDIDYLARIAPPHIAILLSVGHAHIGVFGSQEAIYRTKGEIFTHLRPGGLALAGAHDPRLKTLALGHRVLTFGQNSTVAGADYQAEDLRFDEEGCQQFTGVHGNDRLELKAGMPGPHGLEPVLAAWAVARELGVGDDVVRQKAGHHPGQKGRGVLMKSNGGATLIDDCYNASPETVVNLAQTLLSRPEAKRLMVLGPLAELESGLAETAGIIARHLDSKIEALWLYQPADDGLYAALKQSLGDKHNTQGDQGSPETKDNTGNGGGAPKIRLFRQMEDLINELRKADSPGRVIGIKGARFAHMERFIQALKGVEVRCDIQPCSLFKYCTDCDKLSKS